MQDFTLFLIVFWSHFASTLCLFVFRSCLIVAAFSPFKWSCAFLFLKTRFLGFKFDEKLTAFVSQVKSKIIDAPFLLKIEKLVVFIRIHSCKSQIQQLFNIFTQFTTIAQFLFSILSKTPRTFWQEFSNNEASNCLVQVAKCKTIQALTWAAWMLMNF